MPFPPPPADGLSRAGSPVERTAAAMPANDWSDGSTPGTTGTPASRAARRASIFEPKRAMASADGPTNVRPASAQAAANPAFSERNP